MITVFIVFLQFLVVLPVIMVVLFVLYSIGTKYYKDRYGCLYKLKLGKLYIFDNDTWVPFEGTIDWFDNLNKIITDSDIKKISKKEVFIEIL